MKLTKNRLKEMIMETINDRGESMLLTEVTYAGAKDKINNQKLTFAIFSSYRSERSARQNREVDIKVREFLNSSGYPYTVVEGGYKETKSHRLLVKTCNCSVIGIQVKEKRNNNY